MLAVGGPIRRKRNLTGTGTSSTDSSRTASWSRTNAMQGWSRKPTLPADRADGSANSMRCLHQYVSLRWNHSYQQGPQWLRRSLEFSPSVSLHVWIWSDKEAHPSENTHTRALKSGLCTLLCLVTGLSSLPYLSLLRRPCDSSH